jgi:hypothetical protein
MIEHNSSSIPAAASVARFAPSPIGARDNLSSDFTLHPPNRFKTRRLVFFQDGSNFRI